MPRSGKEARLRLQQAAIDLFTERGFDQVTTAQIAERADVTERTFFRHFPDKREVLFEGENMLRDDLTAALAGIPVGTLPLPTLLMAFRSLVPMLERNRPVAEPLGRLIRATPALWERAAAKEAHLVEMLTAALVDRGVDRATAGLVTRTGWAVLAEATARWNEDPAGGLERRVDGVFGELRTLVAELA